jgi:hypothetical protein
MNESFPTGPAGPTQSIKRSLMLGCGFLPRLRSAQWWKLCTGGVIELQKFLRKPAFALGFALTAPYVALDLTELVIRSHNGPFNGLADVLQTIAIPIIAYLILGLLSLAAMFWGLGACVLGTTALCKTILSIEPESVPNDVSVLKATLQKTLAEAVSDLKQRKSFFFSVWAMYLVLMAVPTLVMLISASVVMLGMPKLGDSSFALVHLNLPTGTMLLAAIALGLSIIAISNYTLVLMPYSSVSRLSGVRVALKGVLLSSKVFLGITIYSIIVFFLSNLLIAPIDLLALFNRELVTNAGMRYLLLTLKAIWHAFFFAVLMPVTMLIPCEMIRGNIE